MKWKRAFIHLARIVPGGVNCTYLLPVSWKKSLEYNKHHAIPSSEKMQTSYVQYAQLEKWKAVYPLRQPSQWCCASQRSLGPGSCPVWWHPYRDRYGRSSPGLWSDRWKTWNDGLKGRYKCWEKEAVSERKGRKSIITQKGTFWSNLIKIFVFFLLRNLTRTWRLGFGLR